jgi:hypothetical protein
MVGIVWVGSLVRVTLAMRSWYLKITPSSSGKLIECSAILYQSDAVSELLFQSV